MVINHRRTDDPDMGRTRVVEGESVSVVLPTDRWTAACDHLAAQIRTRETAEFVIACDRPDDPVVAASEGTVATVVVAGEPRGCSAKCNALAAGLERASGERIVCTDADFDHEPGWLDAVLSHLDDAPEGHVVTTAPVLVRDGGPLQILEGPGVVNAAMATLTDLTAWGGTMAFRRAEIDLAEYITDLRQTVSDDALLTQQVDGIVSVRDLIRETPVPGTVRGTLDRRVRWILTARYFDPGGLAVWMAIPTAVFVGTVLAPLVTIPLVTVLAGVAYAYCGVRRPTFLFVVPAYILILPLFVYGLAKTEFGWNGRQYRWTDTFDVAVLDQGND